MSLWLQGAIEEIDCDGEGCPFCSYQIYTQEETWACVGEDRWQGYNRATELWWLLGKPQRGKRLQDIIGEMERDDDSKLITHWKNPDGTETYTLVNALYDAEATE